MLNKKILAIGLMSLALLIVIGCGKAKQEVDLQTTADSNIIDNGVTTPDSDKNITVTVTNPIATKTAETIVKTDIQTQTPTKKEETTPTPVKEEPKPAPKPMTVSSPAFTYGGSIPSEYTCKGTDLNPQINISNVPAGTKSIAMIMDDPDAPAGTWVHWVLWNIDPKTTAISKNSVPSGAKQGSNSWGKTSYGGPCPPSGTHRYFFKVYALDTTLSLSSATSGSLTSAMSGHVLKQINYMGKFSK